MREKTIAGRLADYGLALRFESLPDNVVHETKRRYIDALGCALGASVCPPVRAARSMAPEVASGAGVIGDYIRTTPDFAAFMNGIMVRYLDYNDTYLSLEPAHPSDNIPAALAAAEASGRTGKDLIAATVAAYEVQCRLCDAASLRAKGFDHVTYGSFSATLAAALLFGLTRDEAVNALGIAGVASPALRQTRAGELSMWKGCAFANSARNSVFAAMLAKAGVTGPAPIFEGEFGFMKLISGEFKLGDFGGENGQGFKVLETYIKYYPAEYHSQSAIGAAIELSGEIEDVSSIESVTIYTFKAAYEIIGSGKERWAPATRETADHSLPFCVGAALFDGNLDLATFSEERLKDAELLKLVARIKVVVDPDLDRLYPEAMPNRVEVSLKSGETLAREIIYPKGHPKDPLVDSELEEKFKDLAGLVLPESKIDRTLEILWNLDGLKDISEIFMVLRGK
jgi:2-methylcitrate dehydratase